MSNFLSNLNNLQQRLIVGFAGAAGIIAGVCLNQWSYFILFAIICFFSLREFHALVNEAGIRTNKFFGVLLGMVLYGGTFLVVTGYLKRSIYIFFIALVFVLFLIELFQAYDKPFERTAFAFLAIIYVALPYSLLHYIVMKNGAYDYKIILGILLMLWANDTGGYFGGRFLGKHKLYERISPKKTWEGSVSGAVLSFIIAGCVYYFANSFSLVTWFGLSLIIVVAGSLGDLVESQLKRSLSIKDSGSSLPGHGGFLDRFDGLIVSIPFIAAYFELL
jgi:phosphatidate cytidylyltransferase